MAQTPVVVHNLYLSTGYMFGGHHGLQLAANYALEEKISFQFAIAGLRQNQDGDPSGNVGLSTGLNEKLATTTIQAGRIFKLNKLGTIRINLTGGLAYLKITEEFWASNPNYDPANNILPTSQYIQKSRTSGSAGFVFNPRLEFGSFTRMGAALGGFLLTYEGATIIGASISISFRLLARPVEFSNSGDRK